MTIGKAFGAGTPGIESGGACAECLWGCETISRNDTVLVKYAYLADGMKAGALNDGGAGLVYRGSLVFRRDSLGMLSFESAPIAAGRMTANGVRYHVTDHLGSVRGVVDGATGALYEASRYGAYGHRSEETNLPFGVSVSTPPAGEASFRYHYTGQEDQGADFGLPYTDFGARHYSPSLRRWLAPDPLSEKYYDVSPYAYCAGDPVNAVDVEGRTPWVVIGLINAGVDFALQTGVKMAQGYSFAESVKSVDYVSVGSSFVLATVSPASTLGKVFRGAVILTDSIVDCSFSDGLDYVGGDNDNTSKPLLNALLDASTSFYAPKAGQAVSDFIAKGLKEEASVKATATITKSMKHQKKALASAANLKNVKKTEEAVISSGITMGKEVIKMAVEEVEEKNTPLVLYYEQGELQIEKYTFNGYFYNKLD